MYGRIPYLNNSLSSWAIHCFNLRRLLYYIAVWLVPHWVCPYTPCLNDISEVNSGINCRLLSDTFELIRVQEAISHHLELKSITDDFLDEFASSVE